MKRGSVSVFSPTNVARSLSLIKQESRLVITTNSTQVILEDKPDKIHEHESDFSLVIPYRPFNSKEEPQISLERSGDLMLADGKVHERPVFAILGILPLITGNYIIVVTDRTVVGSLFGKHEVYGIKRAEVIPIASEAWLQGQPESTRKEEQQYVNFITNFLNSGSFFFSYTYDLSNTMERHQKLQSVTKPEENTGVHPVWRFIDPRFVWNHHLAEPVLGFAKSFGNWFPPIIQGFVYVSNDCFLDVGDRGSHVRKTFGFALISRRNKNRAGTRYHTRGADKDGNVAAFVETEQILSLPHPTSGVMYQTSFVQTRGSIPLFWKQDVDLAYEPPIVIDHNDDSPMRKHFAEQINLYNKNVLVNLVKKKGAEGPLGTAYKTTVRGWNNEKVKYIGFDVYQQCKGDYNKLSKLVKKIEADMSDFGYFATDGKVATKSQSGVFRTNCKDCLDRTNLVQGLFARQNLSQQLIEFGLIKQDTDLENTKFFSNYRHVWADNGDAISITYAGTPALKGDVTRTGKRSVQGMVDDGFNAITRYYVNNFQDGVKQDAIDLFLGNIAVAPSRSGTSVLKEEGLVLLAWIITIFNIIAPLQMRYKYHQIAMVTLILVIVIFVARIFRMGRKVVSTPRLPRRLKQKTG